ncbi:hypothetical protein ASC97_04295 [Rhizobium sp. Root1203]|uniref:hypothetical protein n=1 Tax=Rhizobium sp. Root1203 TaxID=1736427 RepID=UPI000710C4EA|nr:hypothetical protein [Rhizobium sp. Root1203]KQV27604.1 hypothetical protein ASC97_04295 [Rhizobium sp. Root1203]
MSADRNALCSWLADLAAVLVVDEDDVADFNSRISAAPDLSAPDFSAELLSLIRVIGESVSSPEGFDSLKAGSFADPDTDNAGKILLAVGLALAGGRSGWISRPQARAGRERISAAGDAALAVASSIGADAADLYGWLSNLVQVAVRLVSDIAADLVPVVRVETGISLPSCVLSYKLYGDATRAGSLVDIAGSATPMLMPVGFDALEG